jgi:2-methylcitrate dehydratase PrpD
MERVTQQLADFSASLTFGDLDRDLISHLKKYLLDAIGCGLYGSCLPWCQIVNHFIKEQRGKKESTLWLQKFRGPSTNVSLGLGVMIHSFDFDDYHNAKVHPGAVVIPAAMTIGERLGANGKSVLTAIAAGYETMIRVSLATGPTSSRLKGWHLTGTTGPFGAASAAGKLLGLNQDEMASALGMAGTQSGGLWAFTADGAMSKRFHAGRASQSGVMSALLAQKGYKGPTQILEAEDGGFCRATSDQVNFSLATEGLGKRFVSHEVNLKPHACCASAHTAVDGLLELVGRHRIIPSQIDEVLVKTANGVKIQCGFEYEPLSVLQAQMSLQYIVAVTLLEGKALLEQFSEDRISNPQTLELAKRVKVVTDPEIENVYPSRFANKVEVILTNGERYETRVDFARGTYKNPMSYHQVTEKFRSLTSDVIKKDRIEAIVEEVEQMEKLQDIRNLTRLIA